MSQIIYENTDVENYLWEHWRRKLFMRTLMSKIIYENTDVVNYLWEHWCRKLFMRTVMSYIIGENLLLERWKYMLS
jgi:hypothetical protein